MYLTFILINNYIICFQYVPDYFDIYVHNCICRVTAYILCRKLSKLSQIIGYKQTLILYQLSLKLQ